MPVRLGPSAVPPMSPAEVAAPCPARGGAGGDSGGVHSAKLEDPAAAALSAALGDIGTPQKLPSMDLLT